MEKNGEFDGMDIDGGGSEIDDDEEEEEEEEEREVWKVLADILRGDYIKYEKCHISDIREVLLEGDKVWRWKGYAMELACFLLDGACTYEEVKSILYDERYCKFGTFGEWREWRIAQIYDDKKDVDLKWCYM